ISSSKIPIVLTKCIRRRREAEARQVINTRSPAGRYWARHVNQALQSGVTDRGNSETPTAYLKTWCKPLPDFRANLHRTCSFLYRHRLGTRGFRTSFLVPGKPRLIPASESTPKD
ncbi:hypothetical protein COCCADRAFT_82019, partial [Bipolaris zeicola 26-R-13]